MRQIVFYYLLALNLIGGFWLVYAIIATELQNRRERRERERFIVAESEIKRLTFSRLIELQNETNKRAVALEREL
jgi:hypothetical protein